MSEAPERIWAMAPHIGEFYADPPVNDEDKRFLTEYVRADLLPVVKPLEWTGCGISFLAVSIIGEYRATKTANKHNDKYMITLVTARQSLTIGYVDGLEAAKAAAQADYEARIRACLDLIDPAALVAKAR